MVNTIADCFWLWIIILEKIVCLSSCQNCLKCGHMRCVHNAVYIQPRYPILLPSCTYFQRSSPERKEHRNNNQDCVNCNENSIWCFPLMYFSVLSRQNCIFSQKDRTSAYHLGEVGPVSGRNLTLDFLLFPPICLWEAWTSHCELMLQWVKSFI